MRDGGPRHLPLAALSPAAPAPAVGRPPAPVEYSAAVDRYLAQAALGTASRRVYRISLASWAWPLVGQQAPRGTRRRGAAPPIVPLARLDEPGAGPRLATALAERAAVTGARTANRELSALRSVVAWWQDQGWVSADPTTGLRLLAGQPTGPDPLTSDQVTWLFEATSSLREHALWRVLYDTSAAVEEVLSLDIGRLDLAGLRARAGPGTPGWMHWTPGTSQLLRWLVAGRPEGPLSLTSRRAPATARLADTCPVTGRGRLSYRRAAEIFTAATVPLDPAGRGWTLHQLRHAAMPSTGLAG
jgi:integrase/recombinase XerD